MPDKQCRRLPLVETGSSFDKLDVQPASQPAAAEQTQQQQYSPKDSTAFPQDLYVKHCQPDDQQETTAAPVEYQLAALEHDQPSKDTEAEQQRASSNECLHETDPANSQTDSDDINIHGRCTSDLSEPETATDEQDITKGLEPAATSVKIAKSAMPATMPTLRLLALLAFRS